MKDIAGYEGLYAVTSCGKVWSYRSKKFLKPKVNKYGYYEVRLYKEKVGKWCKVHRLVALAYIPNPDSLETVDHIDKDKKHNYINNLCWMSRIDNKKRSWCKSIKCLETDKIFESATIAAKEMGLDYSSILRVCHGEYKTIGGYHFEFIQESD